MRISALLFASAAVLITPKMSDAQQASESTDSSAATASRAKTCRESFSGETTAEFTTKCVALAGPLAVMRGDTLVIRMDDGKRKIFDNKNGDGESGGGFGYGLADFYPSTHIFVVCDYGPDAGQFKAIDGRTGRELDFGSASPQFSPDASWALTIEYGDDGNTPSSFAIHDVRGKKPRRVWSSKASKTRLPAKARFVTWTDEKTIELASPGKKSVFLTQAADGTWGVNSAPN